MANTEDLWEQAKHKCRLNEDDIARAKRLGLNPKSLMKNTPNKSELWKAPVKEWLLEIEAKRYRKTVNGNGQRDRCKKAEKSGLKK